MLDNWWKKKKLVQTVVVLQAALRLCLWLLSLAQLALHPRPVSLPPPHLLQSGQVQVALRLPGEAGSVLRHSSASQNMASAAGLFLTAVPLWVRVLCVCAGLLRFVGNLQRGALCPWHDGPFGFGHWQCDGLFISDGRRKKFHYGRQQSESRHRSESHPIMTDQW